MKGVNYPARVVSVLRLLQLSMVNFWPTFKSIFFPLALLFVMFQLSRRSFFLTGWKTVVVDFCFLIVEIYLVALILMQTHSALSKVKLGPRVLMRRVHRNLPNLYMVFFAVLLFLSLLILGIIFFFKWQAGSLPYWAYSLIFLLFSMIIIVVMIISLVCIPLTVLKQEGFFVNMRTSVFLLHWSQAGSVFLLYVLALLLFGVFLNPKTYHVYWLTQHHMNWPYSILVWFGYVPVLCNYWLLLLNNLFVRKQGQSIQMRLSDGTMLL